MNPVTFWNLVSCALGICGIIFACIMLGYFWDYEQDAKIARKPLEKRSYISFMLSSVMAFGIFACFIFGIVVFVSGVLALLCD